MRRRGPAPKANHERWLVSYADFITLLFAFFVVLYASAQIDKKRVGQLSESIQSGFSEMGTFAPQVFAAPLIENGSLPKESVVPPYKLPLQHELEGVLADELARDEVAIYRGSDGLVISLREVGFFDTGSARLKREALAPFGRIAAVLKKQTCRFRIEGHTDNVPIRNSRFNSNWELSTARATEVVRLLTSEYQFDGTTLSASGYAEFHPVGDNRTSDGRRRNRRVDLIVLDHTGSQP